MKPKRMHMVHNMVVNYGLYKKLDIVVNLRCIFLVNLISNAQLHVETNSLYCISNDPFSFR